MTIDIKKKILNNSHEKIGDENWHKKKILNNSNKKIRDDVWMKIDISFPPSTKVDNYLNLLKLVEKIVFITISYSPYTNIKSCCIDSNYPY